MSRYLALSIKVKTDLILGVALQRSQFLNEEVIPERTILKAYKIVKDTDENDVIFVALTEHLKGSKLWTGDMKLIAGLQKEGFKYIISTTALNDFLDKKEKKK